jgi:transcriptional regulator with XRE-family HTH domain
MRLDSQALLREFLIRAREGAGVTQVELGRRLNKPQSYISKIETGERRIDFIELLALLEAIPIDIRSFVDDFLRKCHMGGR